MSSKILGGEVCSPDALGLREIIKLEIWRGGKPEGYSEAPDEERCVNDLVTNAGRVYLAQRIGANVNSPMAHMAVGTVSTGAALADTAVTGEVKRKALATNTANPNNVYTAVATFGGAAESLSSVSIVEAGILNHASSGNGTLFQRVTFAAVVMADSDLFKMTMMTNVGSNTI
jgi:hypothetical protein